MTFLHITPTATTQVRAPWCHWCLTTHGPRMCKALALAMADPPDGPPTIDEEGDIDRPRKGVTPTTQV